MTVTVNPLDPLAETIPVTGASPAMRTWRAFYHNPIAMVALAVMAAFVATGVFAPLIAPYPTGSGTSILAPPSAAHLFGTDNLGLDILGEVVWGTRDSLIVGAAASALAVAIGVVVAVVGAYFRRVDTLTGMLVDTCLSLPVLPLMILVAALAPVAGDLAACHVGHADLHRLQRRPRSAVQEGVTAMGFAPRLPPAFFAAVQADVRDRLAAASA